MDEKKAKLEWARNVHREASLLLEALDDPKTDEIYSHLHHDLSELERFRQQTRTIVDETEKIISENQ